MIFSPNRHNGRCFRHGDRFRVVAVDPEKRLARLQAQLDEKEREANDLRAVITKVEEEVRVAKEVAALAEKERLAEEAAMAAQGDSNSADDSDSSDEPISEGNKSDADSDSRNSDSKEAKHS